MRSGSPSFLTLQSIRQKIVVPAQDSLDVNRGAGRGIGIGSAMVAANGNGAAFAKGRDFAAWLGLVPKQMSTGDRTILGRTKRGNRYLRTMIMQGARVILLRPANWAKHSFGPWLTAAQKSRQLRRPYSSISRRTLQLSGG